MSKFATCALGRGMITVLALTVAAVAQQPVGNATPSADIELVGKKPPIDTPLDPVVDKILTRLESREVHDLHAELSWQLTYAKQIEEADTKFGEIWYKEFDPVARFLIHLKKKVVDDRARDMNEKHLFDGRWYTELKNEQRMMTRREVRSATDTRNPYKVGEGPFPLPFGQKKVDLVREFEIARVEKDEKNDPRYTDHLVLKPRPGTQTGQNFGQLDFWVEQEEGQYPGLPVKVRLAKLDGAGKLDSYTTITFKSIKLNQGLSNAVFEIERPPGFEYEEETLDKIKPPPGMKDE